MPVAICESAVCKQCRYRLFGLPRPVCPECGLRFDPGDPATYRDLATHNYLHRWVDPPRSGLRWILIILAGYALIGSSSPNFPHTIWNPDFGWQNLVIPAMFVGLAISLQHAARWALVRRAERYAYAIPRYRLMAWWWAPVCILIIASVAAYPWPLWARFQLSKPALTRAAQRQWATGVGTFDNEWCGLYYITGKYIYPSGGIMLGTFGEDMANRRGFVYAPDRNWYYAKPLGDGWWMRTRW